MFTIDIEDGREAPCMPSIVKMILPRSINQKIITA